MQSSAGETGRGLRDRPLGRLGILLAVLVAAVLVARSCGATDPAISKERAVELARPAITDFEPNNEMARFLKCGFNRECWAVSFSIKQPDGRLEHVTVVKLDGNTGEILEILEEG